MSPNWLTTCFINKVLLEHSQVHLLIVYDYFHGTTAELSSCNRDHIAHKPKTSSVWLFTVKVC